MSDGSTVAGSDSGPNASDRSGSVEREVDSGPEASDRSGSAERDLGSGPEASDRSERKSGGSELPKSTGDKVRKHNLEKGGEGTRRPPPLKRGKRSVDDLLKCNFAGKGGSQLRGTVETSAGESKGGPERRREGSVVRKLTGNLDGACGGPDTSRLDLDGGLRVTDAETRDSDGIPSRLDGSTRTSDRSGGISDGSAETDRREQTDSGEIDDGKNASREGLRRGGARPP